MTSRDGEEREVEECVPVHEDFQLLLCLGRPGKGGLLCGLLRKPVWLNTSPAIAPELSAENPWSVQGLNAGKGGLQD